MKKLLTISLFAFGLAALLPANGDLLYFLVNSFDWEGPKYNFDYAMVGVAKSDGDGGWEAVLDGSGNKIYLQVKADGGEYYDGVFSEKSGYYTVAGPAWADLAGYATDEYAFYIETWAKGNSGDYEQVWKFTDSESTATAYSTLLKENHIYTDTTATQDITAWVVPEPSTGMLLLFGLAGLALKRRARRARPTVAGRKALAQRCRAGLESLSSPTSLS